MSEIDQFLITNKRYKNPKFISQNNKVCTTNNMKLILISIVVILFTTVNGKMRLMKFEKCDPNAEYPVELYSKIVGRDDQQFSEEGWLKTPIALDNDLEISVEVFVFEKEKFNYLMTVKKNLCNAIYRFAPEIVYELEDLVGIPRDSCPIPAGEYHVENYLIDLNKLRINTDVFDDGLIKAVSHLMDTTTNTSINCMVTEILKTNE